MESLIKECGEIKSRQKLIDVIKQSRKLLPCSSSFSVTLFYTELLEHSFIPSVRSFLTSSEVDNLLYHTFLLRPKEAIEVVSLALGNISEETHITSFKFENTIEVLRLLMKSEKYLSEIFESASNDSEFKLCIDNLLSIRTKICNLKGVFEKHDHISKLLSDLEIFYENIPLILWNIKRSRFCLYFCFKISQFNEDLCCSTVNKLLESVEKDNICDIFKNYCDLHTRQYNYLFIVLLKSFFTVSQLICMYGKGNAGIKEAGPLIVSELMMDITTSNGIRNFKKFIYVITECLSPQEYLNLVKSFLEKFENQLDMPDFVTVAQLLNIVTALKIMIRQMNDNEKEDIKDHIQNFVMCSWNSMLTADGNRKQITFHFIAWFIDETKCYDEKFKKIKDWEDEDIIKSWELTFLENVFNDNDVEETASTPKVVPTKVDNPPIIESSECLDSDDDDLPSFLKKSDNESFKRDVDSDDETEERYKEFHYIIDCINEISDTNDRLVFVGGIRSLDSLLKKKALGYKEFGTTILKMFIHLRNNYYFEEFEDFRKSILVSTLSLNPHLIVSFIRPLCNEIYSDFERSLCLDVLNLTMKNIKSNDPELFHKIIGEVISTLLCIFNRNSLIMKDIEDNQPSVIKILLTISDLLILAENTPQIISIATKIFRLLKVIRSYNKQSFNTACITVYISLTTSCTPSVLRGSLGGELEEIQVWVGSMINDVNSLLNDEKSMSSEEKFTQRDYAYHLIKNIQSILYNK
uniref:Telomere_reg-2 domain-containing protein n=1 Tax=Strongyloides papillosus TaxID=174720 RepID=A0A0N5CA70_STREA